MGFGGEGVREREGRGKGKGERGTKEIYHCLHIVLYDLVQVGLITPNYIYIKMIEQITHHKGGISKLPIHSRRKKLTCFIR